MRRVALLILLALALPMAAFANSSIDFTNSGGTGVELTDLLEARGLAVPALSRNRRLAIARR